ncbi:hypothetical protein ABW19_dt0203994 [Dactylella cylindrospora]|nr:hypothetical protein ABW19_dt0203994 [Dactylella cylindrospora]
MEPYLHRQLNFCYAVHRETIHHPHILHICLLWLANFCSLISAKSRLSVIHPKKPVFFCDDGLLLACCGGPNLLFFRQGCRKRNHQISQNIQKESTHHQSSMVQTELSRLDDRHF